MAENMLTRPPTSSTPISLPDFPLKSHSAKKISSLYEIEYLSEEDKQFVTFEIPTEFPTEWKRVGYTHIHFGAIRLTLNYHGTAGKPVVARIALLDSRYLEYQNACIVTIEATLNSSLVMVTLFPNFTMALADPNLTKALKVQVQIAGAPQSTSSQITSKGDGTTEIKFDHSHLHSSQNPNIFSTQLMMQPNERLAQLHDQEDPDCCCPLYEFGPERNLIESFSADGKPLYMFKDPVTGHCPWALNCSCELCTDDRLAAWVDSIDMTASKPGKKKKKKNSTQDKFYKRWMNGDPNIRPLGEDNGLEDEELQKTFQTTKVEEPSDDEIQNMPGSSSANQRQTPKSSIGRTTFTIDDLPPAKWPDRIQEFHSWLETRKLTKDNNYNILMEFVSRFIGMLRDWWNSINQHDQMQRKFYKRKCCSYVKRDLKKHFKIMTKLYCALGLNPNLKPVILSSLPNPIQVAVNQALQTQNKDILQITIGELQQEVFVALEDICNRRMIFKDYLHGDKRIDRACEDSYLKYKCPKDHMCDCRTKKKKHFKKHSSFLTSRRRKKVRPRWRYLKKKRKSTKSDHCYICNQKGHFSKNCPKNKKQAKKIAQIVKQSGVKIQENDDIESVCSIEDEPSDKMICAIPACDSSEPKLDYSDIQMIQAKAQTVDKTIGTVLVPHIPVKIYLDKYSKPITIIAFIDTGAAETIMNPNVLPSEWWKPYIRYFDSVADVPFATHLISKPITIQFFPGCCALTFTEKPSILEYSLKE
ncbi:hypothetical protein V6Z12_A11G183700 [Gossypium hirsutum]